MKLGGRALAILHLLVTRAGEEVSRDDLNEFAWPNVVIDERNLKVHISSLRRALGSPFPQEAYIATVARRGYQFVKPVQTASIAGTDFSGAYRPDSSDLPPPSALIGRQDDIAAISRALDFAGLVCLVGPGGVGKTSLAIAVAHARHVDFADGVRFVDLSATDDPALVPHLIATALGVRGSPADLDAALAGHLKGRRALIVLDNCEHVLSAAATMAARLLEPETTSCVLATSRAPLGTKGEDVQRVEPLRFPRKADVRSRSEALAYPSVELFAFRALEMADYRLVDGDANAVARLCAALDGLPLAIEIAAANLERFSAMELLDSVGGHLSALRNGAASAHSRHRTLWATLDWSYQLLSATESMTFRLLSVFAGSFEWADVAAMARLVRYDPYQTTVALGGLVAKSLLSAEIDGEQLRYRLLESARCYASERLLAGPLAQDAHRHHARLVLAALENSEAEWAWVEDRVWRARYERRIGDLRKALDWCFGAAGDPSLGVDLAISAIRLWNEQSSISEQRIQIDRALTHCASMADAPLRQATLATSRAWSMTLARQLDPETDRAWNSALTFANLSGDPVRHLSTMSGRALFLIYTGQNEEAVGLLEEFGQIATQGGDRASLIDGERLTALAEMHLGRLIAVRDKVERLAEELANGAPPSRIVRYKEQRSLSILGTLAFSNWLTGRPRRALEAAEELVATGQLMGQSHVLALVAMPLALWSGQSGSLERYAAMLRDNLERENIAIWEPVHRFYASACRHARGDPNAVDDMRSAIDELVRDRFLVRVPMYLGVLAEALLDGGRSADAERAVETALALQQSKETWCLPELLRVKARTMAALGRRGDARAILGAARGHALAMGGRSFELRIVNDMARMAIADGKGEDAAGLLVTFQEGTEERDGTADLGELARLLTAASGQNAAGQREEPG